MLTGPDYGWRLLGYTNGGGVPVHNMTTWNVGELPVPPIIQVQADGRKQKGLNAAPQTWK